MIKCKLTEKETNAFLYFVNPENSKYIESQVLKNVLSIAGKNIQASFDEDTWIIAGKKVKLSLLQKADKVQELIIQRLQERH